MHKTWSGHIKTKDQIHKMVKGHLEMLKGQGKEIKFLRCNNASKQGKKLTESEQVSLREGLERMLEDTHEAR